MNVSGWWPNSSPANETVHDDMHAQFETAQDHSANEMELVYSQVGGFQYYTCKT